MGLFNRKYTDDNDGDTKSSDNSFFSHSGSFEAVLSEQRQRKQEHAERSKLKRQRKEVKETDKKSKSEVSSEYVKEEGIAKRRRINPEAASKLLRQAGFSVDQPVTLEDEDSRPQEPATKGVIRKSPRLSRTVNVDDSHAVPDPSPNRQVVDIADEDEDEDSDPEIARLRRNAREKKKQQELESSLSLNSADGGADTTTGAANATEARVQYLVASPLEGTTPLLVHRKLSQPLKVLRVEWLKRQDQLPPHLKDQIFLTHCRRKVYDSTTGRALGLKADEDGHVTMTGMESKEGADHVLLEAVTEELLSSMIEAQAAEDRKRHSGTLEVEVESPARAPAKPEEQRFKAHLKAKGKPELKLNVKASTEIAKIEWYARKQWEISHDATFWMEFDGERLENDASIRDTEIMSCEDEVTIDVYIR